MSAPEEDDKTDKSWYLSHHFRNIVVVQACELFIWHYILTKNNFKCVSVLDCILIPATGTPSVSLAIIRLRPLIIDTQTNVMRLVMVLIAVRGGKTDRRYQVHYLPRFTVDNDRTVPCYLLSPCTSRWWPHSSPGMRFHPGSRSIHGAQS